MSNYVGLLEYVMATFCGSVEKVWGSGCAVWRWHMGIFWEMAN